MALTTSTRRYLNQAGGGAGRLGDILSDLHGITVAVTTNASANTTTDYAHGLLDSRGIAIAPFWVAVGGDGYVTWDETNIVYASSTAGAKALTLRITPQPGDGYAKLRKAEH